MSKSKGGREVRKPKQPKKPKTPDTSQSAPKIDWNTKKSK